MASKKVIIEDKAGNRLYPHTMMDCVYDNQGDTLEEKLKDLTWDSLPGKPNQFPPTTHGHSADQISGLPTSLPANGGNADTVGGLQPYQLGTISRDGNSYGTLYPLYCKWDIFNDERFTLKVDGYETRTDYSTNSGFAGDSGMTRALATTAVDGHFLYAERGNGWNTRLRMGYANGDIQSNDVVVGSADYATNATLASDQANFSNRLRNTYLSASAPSGGSHGEVWMKYK